MAGKSHQKPDFRSAGRKDVRVQSLLPRVRPKSRAETVKVPFLLLLVMRRFVKYLTNRYLSSVTLQSRRLRGFYIVQTSEISREEVTSQSIPLVEKGNLMPLAHVLQQSNKRASA